MVHVVLRRTDFGLSLPLMAFEYDFILSAISGVIAILEDSEKVKFLHKEKYCPTIPMHARDYYFDNGMCMRVQLESYFHVDFRYKFLNTLNLFQSSFHNPGSPKKYINYVCNMLTLSDEEILTKYPTKSYIKELEGVEEGISDTLISC